MKERILIVDDEKEIADLLEVYLKMIIIWFINIIMERMPCGAWKKQKLIWQFWM